MELIKTLETRIAVPLTGKSGLEDFEIVKSFQKEEVKPDPERYTLKGKISELSKHDAMLENLIANRNLIVDELEAIHDDSNIEFTFSELPVKKELVAVSTEEIELVEK